MRPHSASTETEFNKLDEQRIKAVEAGIKDEYEASTKFHKDEATDVDTMVEEAVVATKVAKIKTATNKERVAVADKVHIPTRRRSCCEMGSTSSTTQATIFLMKTIIR